MKNVAPVVVALAMLVTCATAETIQIGGQWDLPPGHSEQLTCLAPSLYHQCIEVPGRIISWQGSQTIKVPGVEVLAGANCYGPAGSGVPGQTLWTYEHLEGTFIVQSPTLVPTNIPSSCRVFWMADNNTGAPCFSCLEINVTIYYCTPRVSCPGWMNW